MNAGSNGSKPDGDGKEDKIVRFPTLAERDRMRKQELAKEKAAKARAQAPFFNGKKIPPFTRAMVIVFLAVHAVLYLVLPSDEKVEAYFLLGFVPGYYTGVEGSMPWFALLGPVTHMFVHGGWMHLAFNTVMALALGMFFETQFGMRRTVIFFFICGLAGAALFFILNPHSMQPVIGASGGLSGLFGALLILQQQRGRFGIMNRRGPWPLVIFWAAFMVLIGIASGDNIAWQTHIGGFLTGALIIYLAQKGKIKF
jgi:membrane associated rhomboid family serine protease